MQSVFDTRLVGREGVVSRKGRGAEVWGETVRSNGTGGGIDGIAVPTSSIM